MEVFPKRKELASLKQLFVLHGKISIFLHAPPLNAETNQAHEKITLLRSLVCLFPLIFVKKNIHNNERSNVASKMSGLTF